MILTKKFFSLLLVVATLSIIAGQKNDDLIVETETTAETTTSNTEITTTDETTTTTTPAPTPTTTTEPPTTTTPAPSDKIFNFTLPKNTSLPTCLRLRFSLAFDITYTAEFNATQFNNTVNVKLDDYTDYDGMCNDSLNTFSLTFEPVKGQNWTIQMWYSLKTKNEYSLDTFALNYTADPSLFGNITKDESGKTVEVRGSGLDQFAASKGNSFKCTSETKFTVDNKVSVEFKNYQGQPFISPDSKSKDFDTAIECQADTKNTGKLVPIIVGSSLAVLVVLVLIAYIVGRHKHRNGYQTV